MELANGWHNEGTSIAIQHVACLWAPPLPLLERQGRKQLASALLWRLLKHSFTWTCSHSPTETFQLTPMKLHMFNQPVLVHISTYPLWPSTLWVLLTATVHILCPFHSPVDSNCGSSVKWTLWLMCLNTWSLTGMTVLEGYEPSEVDPWWRKWVGAGQCPEVDSLVPVPVCSLLSDNGHSAISLLTFAVITSPTW